MIEIHPTAVVHPTATLGARVHIGPYAVVGEHVVLGEGTVLGPHAIIEPHTTLGRDCHVHGGAVVGGVPQDLKFSGERSSTVIGDRNVIRECVTINRATGEGETTRIGDDNLFMAYVHVAHNCVIGNGNVLANGVTLAGHVVIEDLVTIGGLSGVHQFTRVGALGMVGAMTRLVQDLPPYMLVEGHPPRVYGPNLVGLKRRGIEAEDRRIVKQAYKALYRSGLSISQALEEMAAWPDSAVRDQIVTFIRGSERGIVGKVVRTHASRTSEDAAGPTS